MSDIQQDAHYHNFVAERFHRINQKEISGMLGEGNPMLARLYGSNGQRSGNMGVDDNQNKATLTLTHRVCHELKRTGTQLIHRPRNERPYRLCFVHKQ